MNKWQHFRKKAIKIKIISEKENYSYSINYIFYIIINIFIKMLIIFNITITFVIKVIHSL